MLTLDQLQRRFKRRSNKLSTRRAAFLEYTTRFYTADNRAFKVNKVYGTPNCVYSPTSTSPGCAIGQHLPDKEFCEELDSAGTTSKGGIGILAALSRIKYEGKFPNWMKDLGDRFLFRVQQLHDAAYNWNQDGLSSSGLDEVEHIKEECI